MAKIQAIEGLKSLLDKLQRRTAAARRDSRGSVIVGYTQEYAVYVHENLNAWHEPPTRAKYLEGPARQLANSGILTTIVRTAHRAGQTLLQGLLQAGLRLQRESQGIVPVDTGALRASAFTRIER